MPNENDSKSTENPSQELAAMDPKPDQPDGVKAGGKGGNGPKAENDPVGEPDPDGGVALA
jgi:hypothetical protein